MASTRHNGGRGGSNRRFHQSKKGRIKSHYGSRLSARGLNKAPRMASIDSLRKKQGIYDSQTKTFHKASALELAA